jgi:hypothetical protein
MIRIGMNPLVEERMLGNFNAKNTKERAAAPKKKVHLSSFFVIPFSMSSLSHCRSFLTVLPFPLVLLLLLPPL